ncbi:MAG: hypothetical protein O2807_03705 [bacterium]|nr:hypothetical protein [bacterium]
MQGTPPRGGWHERLLARNEVRKWARLIVCVAFHVISLGLAAAIMTDIFGAARPGRYLLIPGVLIALIIGLFYTADLPGNRIAGAGNLAGGLSAVNLWVDISYRAGASGALAYLARWEVWLAYLLNAALILAAGWWMEKRRA